MGIDPTNLSKPWRRLPGSSRRSGPGSTSARSAPNLDEIRACYKSERQRLLQWQEQQAEAARGRIRARDRLQHPDGRPGDRVLRPFTGAVTDTTDDAVAPALTVLSDPFTLALQRAEDQANDLLDEILSEGNRPLIIPVDLQLRNREVATEADVQALVEEIRGRLLEQVRGRRPGATTVTGVVTAMSMTPDAKHALAATIRSLRTRLLTDLHAATETAYRLSVPGRDSGLDEAARARRGRLKGWIAEQVRTQSANGAKADRSAEDFRLEAEKQAAYTLLNRLVLLRLMEAPGPSGHPSGPPPW